MRKFFSTKVTIVGNADAFAPRVHLITLHRSGFGTDRRSQIRDFGVSDAKQFLKTAALPMFAFMLR